jgi:hypothetical protein
MNKHLAPLLAAFLLGAPRLFSETTPAAATTPTATTTPPPATTPAPAPAPTSDWSFEISPYLWVAGVKIDTTLDVSPPTTPPSASRFETKLSGGLLFAAQARYKSFGLWVDFVWVQTDTNSIQPGPGFASMNLKSDFYHTTAALSYELPLKGNFHMTVLAGGRYWSVNPKITATAGLLPGFTASQDQTWVAPIIGMDLGYDLGAKWTLLAKGTTAVGGGDSSGWEAMGGAAYRFCQTWSMTLGYRYLHEEYAKKRFSYITDVSGVILGASARF